MAECFRCGSDQHLIQDCDYDAPVTYGNRPHGYSLNTGGTYLAELEDSKGHPMALRVKLQSKVTARPPCPHKHSRACHEPGGHLQLSRHIGRLLAGLTG